MQNISLCDNKLSINIKSCTTFTTDVQNVRRQHYRDVLLTQNLLSDIRQYSDFFYIFQQDEALSHHVRGTVELQLIRETPDLNPVDYTAWGVLQELVYREKIRTVQEMHRTLWRSGNA